jgi:tetratricopeptide (TPR) repeat protein
MIHQQAGRIDEAIPMLEKAVAMYEQTYGPEHLETGNQLTALGAAYRAQSNHEEAQKHLRRALKIHEKTRGVQSPEAIQDLHHLAGSREESGDLGGAAAQYERALLFKHRVIGGDIDELAELQMGMATLYVNWQNYSRARELLLECVAGFRRKGGARLAVGYETLGYVEECSGRYAEAVRELQLAAKVWETLIPERLPELLRCLAHRADLLELLRRKGEAERLRERIATLGPELEGELAAAG